MDDSEALCARFLDHIGAGPGSYEPDGNQPPDFLLPDGTAIEVRRLNQHADVDGAPVALEQDMFPVLKGMRALVETIGAPVPRTWWISYTLSRPALPWKQLRPRVREVLLQIAESGVLSPEPVRVHPCLTLRFVPATEAREQSFLIGGFVDRQAGGWLLSELQRNIQICSDEKAAKVARVRAKYRRWWLVLVDYIGRGRGASERELFEQNVHVEHSWDRLILLDPSDHTRAHDVESSSRTA
jgi:hypothetical protein